MKYRSLFFGAIGALGLACATPASAGYWTAGAPALSGKGYVPADSGLAAGAPPQAGYFGEAWGVSAVTGTLDLNTGLNTVVACTATMQEDAALSGLWVTVTIQTQTGATAGHVTLKAWKPTASGDTTPIAATAAKNIGWRCIGT